MKILHCLDSIDPAFGGPVEAARQFARFRQPGTEVEVLTLDDEVSAWSAAWPVRVHAIGKGYSIFRYNPDLVTWLNIRHKEYDAVVVHGLFRYNLVGTWQALRGTACPYYVIPHGMLNPWFKARYPLKHLEKSLFWHWRIKHAMAGAAGIIYLTEEESRLANETFDITTFRTAYHPLGIEDPLHVLTPAAPVFLSDHGLAKKRLIVFFGRICEMKGCDVLIRALAETDMPDDAVLVFAGPDNEGIQSRLQELSRELGVADRIRWCGPVYGAAKFELLRRAELFVLPSHCETFPVAVLEALGTSVPVLVSDKVNLWKIIKAENAGLICSDDTPSLSSELSSWFAKSNLDRSRMAQNARRCFEANFRIEHAVRMHEETVAWGVANGKCSTSVEPHLGSTHHEAVHG
jgi:glycosyltransferase involved in cell wall biosynthesis